MENDINLQRQEIIRKITEWLHEEGFTINDESDDSAYYKATIYQQTPSGGKTPRISINIPKDKSDKIYVETTFGSRLREEAMDFFKDADDFKDADNANKLTAALHEAIEPLNITSVGHSATEDVEVKVFKTIYFNGFSKHVLLETIGDVRAAFNAMNLAYQKLKWGR